MTQAKPAFHGSVSSRDCTTAYDTLSNSRQTLNDAATAALFPLSGGRSIHMWLILRDDAACRRFGTPSPNVSHSSAMTHDCLFNGRRLTGSCFSSLSLSFCPSLLWRSGEDYYTVLLSFPRHSESVFRTCILNIIIIKIEVTHRTPSPRAVATRILPSLAPGIS